MTRGRRAVVALTLACACTEARVVEVPPGVDRVAIAVVREGVWQTASGLLASGGQAAHRAALAADGEGVVLGWSDLALGEVLGSLPAPTILEADALRAPSGCEAVLPQPSWALAVDTAGTHPLDPTRLGPLTAGWAAESCPDVQVSTAVVCGESATVCPVRAVERRGCQYLLDFECEIGPVVVGFGAEQACTTTPGCSARRGSDGEVVVSCEARCGGSDPACERPVGCQATVLPDRRLSAEVTHLRLGTGADRVPPDRLPGELWPEQVISGYLGTPVLVGAGDDEQLVVPVHPWRHNRHCTRDDEATELVRVSTVRGGVAGTVAAPPCLDLLVADERGGFVGTFGGPTVGVARFDAGATVTASISLPQLPPVARRTALLDAADGALVLVYGTTDPRVSVLALLDGATLGVRAHLVLDDFDAVGAAVLDDGRIVVVDDAADLMVWFDSTLTTCVGSASAHLLLEPLMDLGNVPVLSLTYVAARRRLLALVGELPAIHVFEDLCSAPTEPGPLCQEAEGRCRGGLRTLTWDRGAEPIRAEPWPPGSLTLAVAATLRPSPRTPTFSAVLGLYDAETPRFVPGIVKLGFGIGRDLVVDGTGALWVSLPWAGELARVRTR